MTEAIEKIVDRSNLASWLGDPLNNGRVVQTVLKPSDRVIARVTDGIYRQPASALRELISNAWDADAQNVTIMTDAPRFAKMYVRDDGLGMSYESLARLMHNIGGSAKRIDEGMKLGITNASDPERTPSGRRIIGKIGIGLFSVSQLAKSFRIITKTKGASFRLSAEIQMHQYREDGTAGADGSSEYIAGDVYIRREETTDFDAHGTDIILDGIRPRVRDLLRDADNWEAIREREDALEAGDTETWANLKAEKPSYHSGFLGRKPEPGELSQFEVEPNYPWGVEVRADDKMGKLIDAVEEGFSRKSRPDLATTLDKYLEMIWNLGLSSPVEYEDKHPFDLTNSSEIDFFWLSGAKGKGDVISLGDGQSVRDAVAEKYDVQLDSGYDPKGKFAVNIDGITLKKPIRFKHHKSEARGLSRAVMFVGKFSPDMGKISIQARGGDLEVEGYLFWTGRMVPKENNGVLVRIREASGALFDPTFFKYQVAEQTRLRQISSEIFVREGLDAALNIDRESFNFAHPHFQLVSLWLHNSIKQLTNRLKDLATKKNAAERERAHEDTRNSIVREADVIWSQRRGTQPTPEVRIAGPTENVSKLRSEGYVTIRASGMTGKGDATGNTAVLAEAIAKVLLAHEVMEGLDFEAQEALISDIISVFRSSEN
ncbi:ATP-binding protein [Roseivivax sp. CAU 1753]